MGEILDRRALAQELGVGADGEIGVGPQAPHPPLDLAARADRDRRFRGHNGKARQMRHDLFDRLIDIGEVGVAIAAAHRRAHREKDQIGRMRDSGKLSGEMQAAGAHVLLDEDVEPRLVNRDLAAFSLLDSRASLSTQVTFQPNRRNKRRKPGRHIRPRSCKYSRQTPSLQKSSGSVNRSSRPGQTTTRGTPADSLAFRTRPMLHLRHWVQLQEYPVHEEPFLSHQRQDVVVVEGPPLAQPPRWQESRFARRRFGCGSRIRRSRSRAIRLRGACRP